MIIGILGRPNIVDNSKKMTYSKDLINVILKHDNIPLGIIPPVIDINKELDKKEREDLYKIIDLCNGIILQGGTDYYNYDIEAIDYIIEKDIPLLGICLWMQSMALSTGGSEGHVEGHKSEDSYVHDIKIDKDSKLYSMINKEYIEVNSRHKDVIVNPGTYSITAYDLNGNVEAIELPSKRFNIGVQWHPELLDDDNSKKIFNSFFKAVEEYKSK
jgi:putative glutamine amidotransferase